ncbi:esterase [Arsenicicoccus sp. oral taxon 190]|nr:esterase [Arsenicicoccus sp. oral taxon 190]
MQVLPGATPFRCSGRPEGHGVGVLLSHGFTGTPQSLRPWAEHLAERGYAVRLPRLPGHGTTWQGLNRTEWHDWLAVLERELHALWDECETVVVGGLSLGGALVTRLAEEHGPRISGLMLVNPAYRSDDLRLRGLPVMRRLVPSIAGIASDIHLEGVVELAYDRTPLHALASMTRLWRLTVRDLPEITQPVLLCQSDEDHVVPASSSELLLSRISSTDVTHLRLRDSYHVATLDHDAARIFEESVAFIERVTTGEGDGDPRP